MEKTDTLYAVLCFPIEKHVLYNESVIELMKTIVISAVNLRKGGTLTILRNCLECLSDLAQERQYRVVALVHKKELANYSGIE